MTERAAGNSEMADEGRTTHPVLIFFIFALAGPPIGLVSAVAFEIISGTIMTWITGRATSPPLDTLRGFSIDLLFSSVTLLFLALAYLFGGLQAAFTGAITATWSALQGRLSLKAAALSSLVAGLLFCATMLAVARTGASATTSTFVSAAFGWTAIHIAAGLGSWALTHFALTGLRQMASRSRSRHDRGGYD